MKAITLLSLVLLWSYFASAQTEPGGQTLLQLNHRAFTAMEGTPTGIAAFAQTPDGTLWIGGRTGLMRFDGLRFVPYPGPSDEPLKQTNVASLLATADGSLWISFRPNGVSVLKRGRVTHYGKSDGLPEGTVAQFAQDLDGSIWAAARTGFAHFDGTTWRTVARAPELGSPYGVMIDGAGTLWVATAKGLRARVAGESHFREIDNRSYLSPRGLVLSATNNGGIRAAARDELIGVEPGDIRARAVATIPGMDGGPLLIDVKGNLWSADVAKNELLRVEFAELSTSAPRNSVVLSQRFTRADGLGSGPVQALLEDRERNIWVATNTSLHRFTQSNVVRDTAPSCSHYGSLNSPPIAAGDAGSLWIDTNIGPGRYTFRVIASNNDGVWNETGASISFIIPPAFYQTHWFYGLCALAFATVLGMLYHIRVRQVTARVRDRLELRLAERERIARVLHDTLLQGVQGLIMKVHSAVLQIPTQESAREDLEHALDQAQQVLVEGRDRVTSLRLGTGQERDLTDDIAGIGEDMAEGTETEFRASTHGVARALHPIVREEGFQIIREAILNAFRHARATYVRAEVFYNRRELRITVIDDGCGVPPQVLAARGREHHWGMVGMRERAAHSCERALARSHD